MNKETTLNQSVNVLQQSDKIENRSMSCEEENSDSLKKSKHLKLDTPNMSLLIREMLQGKCGKSYHHLVEIIRKNMLFKLKIL